MKGIIKWKEIVSFMKKRTCRANESPEKEKKVSNLKTQLSKAERTYGEFAKITGIAKE